MSSTTGAPCGSVGPWRTYVLTYTYRDGGAESNVGDPNVGQRASRIRLTSRPSVSEYPTKQAVVGDPVAFK